jgi:hypothetical protein
MLAIVLEGTPDFDAALARLESRGESDFARVEPVVREILTAVRRGGDAAVQPPWRASPPTPAPPSSSRPPASAPSTSTSATPASATTRTA